MSRSGLLSIKKNRRLFWEILPRHCDQLQDMYMYSRLLLASYFPTTNESPFPATWRRHKTKNKIKIKHYFSGTIFTPYVLMVTKNMETIDKGTI